ncbi:aldo/keto reductase [Roseovarius salinarum]|uniref:aldo/keto reductase n=1 Tax=Roseovarius salinarum TaxID=1981892 RepID=UPI000C33D8CE|nr:aldo/keto reductase [Roseovarius salinarum]
MSRNVLSPDGTQMSRFAFGTMQFGGRADAAASREMFEACLAAGINHFDTAHVYNDGAAERLLGRFAAPHRAGLIVATKAGYTGGAGRENLLAQFDESRRRLDMDVVDILYLHRFDPGTPLRESVEALAELHVAGRIRYAGVSNFAAWQAMKALGLAREVGLPLAVAQPMYNLVKRQAEVEILPMARSEGLAVAPYSPLAGGLLTGKYARGEAGRLTEDTRYAARYGPGWMHEAAGKLAGIAGDVGTRAATLAAAWVARHPARPAPILSARSAEQLAPSLAAADFAMDDTLYARLSALTPAPPPATDRLEEA